MQRVSLEALGHELLDRVNAAGGGHAAATVVGGQEHVLCQTVIAIVKGAALAEHEGPGGASVYVLSGRARLASVESSWDRRGGRGHLLTGSAGRCLHPAQTRVGPYQIGRALRRIAREAEHHLRIAEHPAPTDVLVLATSKTVDATVVAREAGRRKKIRLEANVEPVIHRFDVADQFRFDRRRDRDDHAAGIPPLRHPLGHRRAPVGSHRSARLLTGRASRPPTGQHNAAPHHRPVPW